jgi:hypothetical protein
MFKSYRWFALTMTMLGLLTLALIVMAVWAAVALNLLVIAGLGIAQLVFQRGWVRVRRVYWEAHLKQLQISRDEILEELDDAIDRDERRKIVEARYRIKETTDAIGDAIAMVSQLDAMIIEHDFKGREAQS